MRAGRVAILKDTPAVTEKTPAGFEIECHDKNLDIDIIHKLRGHQ